MPADDNWDSGDLYEMFMGRWSRVTAVQFLEWLGAKPNLSWLDLGCGTGALTAELQRNTNPQQIIGVDPTAAFVELAQSRLGNAFTQFKIGDATHIPVSDNSIDMLVSGLAFNFFPDTQSALSEMRRVVKPGGVIAIYVWDYSGKMEFLRYFWDTAVFLDPTASVLDEGKRFPNCKPEFLSRLFIESGLEYISVTLLDTPTHFANFDDYWKPFLGGVGPAPSYFADLNVVQQERFEQTLRSSLPFDEDGSIPLIARAWAVRGVVM